MSILWLAVEDEPSRSSDRAYFERNAIGLLAVAVGIVDVPSPNWLGHFSEKPEMKNSGLWNKESVRYEYSPNFLDILNEYVSITLGKRAKPPGSLAPFNWNSHK
jgi:hypothetical protein